MVLGHSKAVLWAEFALPGTMEREACWLVCAEHIKAIYLLK